MMRKLERGSRLVAVAAIPVLALTLLACAPEPIAGAHVKGQDTSEDGPSWSQQDDPNDPALKHAELPASFPTEEFSLPQGATIDDAGERGSGIWFVVLKAADDAQADAWWSEVIEGNGFVARDVADKDSEGNASATLAGSDLTVTALRLPPQSDGTVLLSYDIRQEL